ncbi:hypothetical protein HAX54_018747 [Datura stramonium]|uniref:Ubiquitin-like protease family profile domain-containing protein n=1 Tax=Datura stramonium TaxID=4076 RepID=A0ABS8UPK0_DATST|nr:hypothetical protein [Datura stramonium]
MPKVYVQNQLICYLVKNELVRNRQDIFYVGLNGSRLSFGFKEFALVTGLRIEGDINDIEPDIAFRLYNRMPQILNWKVVNKRSSAAFLCRTIFNNSIEKLGRDNNFVCENDSEKDGDECNLNNAITFLGEGVPIFDSGDFSLPTDSQVMLLFDDVVNQHIGQNETLNSQPIVIKDTESLVDLTRKPSCRVKNVGKFQKSSFINEFDSVGRVDEISHWVLEILSFENRTIHVYDSIRGAIHDVKVIAVVDTYGMLIPHFLSTTGFYKEKKDVDFDKPSYSDMPFLQSLAIYFVDGLPLQSELDCGIYIDAFAEYFIHNLQISPNFTIDQYQNRISCLLWDYG